MYLSTLQDWLMRIANAHVKEIDLGLERVKAVAEKLGLDHFSLPIITVGGTNGKGSTVAGLEAIYLAAGYRTGAFTSPILFKHNEYVRLNAVTATDDEFCRAYVDIEAARGSVSLTPFEYHTLAALHIFRAHELDVIILEVGLGGRLDAVNILDADVSVITSISIDHVEYLGPTREHIGFEKAGIFRAGRKAVCGDEDPPASLLNYAYQLGVELFCQQKDFFYQPMFCPFTDVPRLDRGTQDTLLDPAIKPRDVGVLEDIQESRNGWSWISAKNNYDHLPFNSLYLPNMSTVLMTIELMQSRLPVNRQAIDQGLLNIKLLGRIQIIPGEITTVYDVSHNPAGIKLLIEQLKKMPIAGKTFAVFSMLADKDILGSVKNGADQFSEWYVAPLQTVRAASMEKLKTVFDEAGIHGARFFTTIHEAHEFARGRAKPGDRIVVFGSFHTVAEGMTL